MCWACNSDKEQGDDPEGIGKVLNRRDRIQETEFSSDEDRPLLSNDQIV